MKKIILSAVLSAFIFCFFACKKQQQTAATTFGFYFWKNIGASDYYSDNDSYYDWFIEEKIRADIRDSLNIKRIYVKILDIDWSPINKAYPRSHNYLPEADSIFSFVPTIFITNRVFKEINEVEINDLSDKVFNKIYNGVDKKDAKIKEIQFDCDWTDSTREKYFQFLKIFKQKAKNCQISATIRLYQYKYREKTGVPPVDKGMLMLYNLQDLKRYDIANSIFDAQEAKAYLDNQPKYPLPTDAALPLFSWAVGFHEGEAVALHNGVSQVQADTLSFLKKEKKHYYEVKKDCTFEGHYYRTGDKIKVEYIDQEGLQSAANLAKNVIYGENPNIVFYHLDQKIIERYGFQNLKNIQKIF
jgi:hypothetical protein